MPELNTQVNTAVDSETVTMLDQMCEIDVRNRAQMVRWLIRQEFARRFSQPSLMTVAEAENTTAGE